MTPIPLFYPHVSAKMRKAVNETLKTRWIGQGPKVDEFEKEVSERFGNKTPILPVAVNSATSALELAYELVGLKAGDEVISTPYTCTATNIPLLRRGVKIVFADIRKNSMNIDGEDILRKVTKKTKAIVVVNMGGIRSWAYEDIREEIGNIPVITDSSQAFGFTNGDYVIYSFQAIKNITTGDGGMLLCPNEETYKKAKLLRWFGIDREKKKKMGWQAYKNREMTFDIEYPGYKYQMNDIAASMGIAALSEYDDILEKRRKLTELYRFLLEDVVDLSFVESETVPMSTEENTFWLFTVLVEKRDKFAKKMKDHGIEVNMVHIRNDLYKIFGGKRQELPVMNELEDKYICLPLHMKLTMEKVAYISKIIKGGW